MIISKTGLELIKTAEGFSPEAYQDIVGVLTIGYGTATTSGASITSGMVISEAKATEMLMQEVSKIETQISKNVKVPLTQGQIDALISFAYNLGVHALLTSTLWKKLNAGDITGASKEFMKWNKAGGKEVKGLTNRRKAEQAIFNS